MDHDLDRLRRDSYEGEERRSPDRREPAANWIKDLAPYAIGAAVIYAQFMVMADNVADLEAQTAIQWQKISHHLENHP